MRLAPFRENKPYDPGVDLVVKATKEDIDLGKDDGLFIFTGTVGSGKSHLSLHCIEEFTDKPDIEQIALTREQFAKAHNILKKKYMFGVDNRFLLYDECDLTSRASMSEWNRDVMRLYSTNRVFGGFHLWCNPSIAYLDKFFVQERVKGVFFIFTKDVKRPRRYYFYTKKGILKMLDANIKLTHFNLKKHAAKFAFYIGWFKEYKGDLLTKYMDLKKHSAGEIDQEFFSKYTNEKTYSKSAGARMLGISIDTMTRLVDDAVKLGLLDESEIKNQVGHYRLTKNHILKLKEQ